VQCAWGRSAQALIAAHGESVQGAVRVKMPAIARLPLALLPPSGAQNNARRYGRACHEAVCGGIASSIHFSGFPHHRTPLKRCVSVLWAASLLPRKCSCLDHYSCFIPNSCAPRRSPTESQQPVQIMSDQLCASGQPGAMRGRCTESAHWRQGGYGTVLGWRCRWRPKSKVHPVERLLCRSSLAHRRAQGARPCSPACSPTKPAPPARVRIRQQLMP